MNCAKQHTSIQTHSAVHCLMVTVTVKKEGTALLQRRVHLDRAGLRTKQHGEFKPQGLEDLEGLKAGFP